MEIAQGDQDPVVHAGVEQHVWMVVDVLQVKRAEMQGQAQARESVHEAAVTKPLAYTEHKLQKFDWSMLYRSTTLASAKEPALATAAGCRPSRSCCTSRILEDNMTGHVHC